MENKLLTTIKFEPRKADVIIGEDELTISDINFSYHHDQDCCENVYADFSVVKYYKKQIEDMGEINKIEIKSVEDCGFIIFIYKAQIYYEQREGILINCYNSQNGYYSSDLQLVIKYNGKEERMDLEKYDNIF